MVQRGKTWRIGPHHSAQTPKRNTFIWVSIPHRLMRKIWRSFVLAMATNDLGTSWSVCGFFSKQNRFSGCGRFYEAKWCVRAFQSPDTRPLPSKVSFAHENQLDHPRQDSHIDLEAGLSSVSLSRWLLWRVTNTPSRFGRWSNFLEFIRAIWWQEWVRSIFSPDSPLPVNQICVLPGTLPCSHDSLYQLLIFA